VRFKARSGRTAGAALCALLLCACMDNTVYVRTDGSPAALFGVAHLLPPKSPPAMMDLGVTFKSAGRIIPSASDTLYQAMRDGLARSHWSVRRLGGSSDDFSDAIGAIVTAAAGTLPAQPSSSGVTPRLLMLVENAPDLSAGTQTRYFLSGMTFGAWSLHKPTDRYDVTLSYRDPQGLERVYRSHQDLLFSTGSKLFGRDQQGLEGLKHYDTPVAAFKGVVDNSVYGARRGTVTAGTPRFDPPKAQAPVQAHAPLPVQPRPPAPAMAPQPATTAPPKPVQPVLPKPAVTVPPPSAPATPPGPAAAAPPQPALVAPPRPALPKTPSSPRIRN
jgi:hypothetical protein